MKLVYTEGCICFGCDIDNRDITYYTDKEIKDISNLIFNKFNRSDLEDFIVNYIQSYGEPEYQYTCEECGDSVYTYTLNI